MILRRQFVSLLAAEEALVPWAAPKNSPGAYLHTGIASNCSPGITLT